MYGVSLFFIGSIIAGAAININVVIIGRLFQGFGMVRTFDMVFILASSSFPPERRSFSAGLLVIFFGLAQAFGLTIGGLIVEHWGWRWNFLINITFFVEFYAG